MALYMVYRKVAESETEVMYNFGSSETEMDRGLVIQKVSSVVRAAEGTTGDPLLMKVAARILARKGTDQTWPGGGGIQA